MESCSRRRGGGGGGGGGGGEVFRPGSRMNEAVSEVVSSWMNFIIDFKMPHKVAQTVPSWEPALDNLYSMSFSLLTLHQSCTPHLMIHLNTPASMRVPRCMIALPHH